MMIRNYLFSTAWCQSSSAGVEDADWTCGQRRDKGWCPCYCRLWRTSSWSWWHHNTSSGKCLMACTKRM